LSSGARWRVGTSVLCVYVQLPVSPALSPTSPAVLLHVLLCCPMCGSHRQCLNKGDIAASKASTQGTRRKQQNKPATAAQAMVASTSGAWPPEEKQVSERCSLADGRVGAC
jgi:hypothetical protein